MKQQKRIWKYGHLESACRVLKLQCISLEDEQDRDKACNNHGRETELLKLTLDTQEGKRRKKNCNAQGQVASQS